jgi:hypothetical protein
MARNGIADQLGADDHPSRQIDHVRAQQVGPSDYADRETERTLNQEPNNGGA